MLSPTLRVTATTGDTAHAATIAEITKTARRILVANAGNGMTSIRITSPKDSKTPSGNALIRTTRRGNSAQPARVLSQAIEVVTLLTVGVGWLFFGAWGTTPEDQQLFKDAALAHDLSRPPPRPKVMTLVGTNSNRRGHWIGHSEPEC